MSEETRDVLEKAELMMQKGWLAGYERVTPELVEEIRRLREALRDLKGVVVDDLLPLANEHGGELWMADALRIESVFERVDTLLPTGDSDDQ